MDGESLKSLSTLVAGVLGFAGGVLAFLNGRLKDAEGSDAKAAVIRSTWSWLAAGLSVLSAVVVLSTRLYAVAGALIAISYVIEAYLFLGRPGKPGRPEILMIAIHSSVLCGMLTFLAIASLLERVVDLQGRMVEMQQEVVKQLQGGAKK